MGAAGKFVPRTDRQTIVAAIDPVAQRLAEFQRDRILQLDSQVGNTAPRIEPVGHRKSGSRAGILASRAGTATVAARWVRFKFQRGIDRPEEQPRTMVAADQVGVFALPAEARRFAERLFHHRRRIDEDLHAGFTQPAFFRFGHQPARQGLQRLLHGIVIVATLGIDRDPRPVRLISQGQGIAARSIAHPQGNHAARFAPQALGAAAVMGAAFHPFHAAVQPFAQPLFQPRRAQRIFRRRGNSAGGKAQPQRLCGQILPKRGNGRSVNQSSCCSCSFPLHSGR